MFYIVQMDFKWVNLCKRYAKQWRFRNNKKAKKYDNTHLRFLTTKLSRKYLTKYHIHTYLISSTNMVRLHNTIKTDFYVVGLRKNKKNMFGKRFKHCIRKTFIMMQLVVLTIFIYVNFSNWITILKNFFTAKFYILKKFEEYFVSFYFA